MSTRLVARIIRSLLALPLIYHFYTAVDEWMALFATLVFIGNEINAWRLTRIETHLKLNTPK